jgi:hypothetical protein
MPGRACKSFGHNGTLDAFPYALWRLFHRNQQLGHFGYVFQVLDQIAAYRARIKVFLVLGGSTAIDDVRQGFLELCAGHESSPPDTSPDDLLTA